MHDIQIQISRYHIASLRAGLKHFWAQYKYKFEDSTNTQSCTSKADMKIKESYMEYLTEVTDKLYLEKTT
jgi:hypothetical protein